jgi:hypothetical protein
MFYFLFVGHRKDILFINVLFNINLHITFGENLFLILCNLMISFLSF